MDLTAAHWVYLAGVVVVIVTMILRKNVVVPAVAATFATAVAFSGSFLTGLTSVFNASLSAATNLFNIFLVIALVTALLGSMRAMGADKRMITPFQRVMRNGHIAFWVLAGVTYVISLFFWPTPAVPLIGAVLIPVAIRAGLPAMGVGMVIAIAGQGMALSSDYIIRVAPGLSATAAGTSTNLVADRAMVLSLVTGGVALIIGYLMTAKEIRRPSARLLAQWEGAGAGVLVENEEVADEEGTFHEQEEMAAATVAAEGRGGTRVVQGTGSAGDGGTGASSTPPPPPRTGDDNGHAAGIGEEPPMLGGAPRGGNGAAALGPDEGESRYARLFAIMVPLAYLALIVYMMLAKFNDSITDLQGGEAAALVGGIAAILLFFAALAKDGVPNFLETAASHVVDGLVFAFKAMGVVLPIAGFFFIGSGDFSGAILGLPPDAKGPSFLFDLVQSAQSSIPHNGFISGFGILIIGMITGLDGSGFSGLPLTGALSGGLGPAVGMDPATLAAIGQMGSVWAGGGTLVAWSSLIAVAGFARVSSVDLARKLFIPVIAGLIVSTIVGVLLF